MSRSSAASKRLSASSRFRAAGIIPVLSALAEARGLVALRVALRIGFGAYVLAIVAFALAMHGNALARIAAAIVPALGAMSIVLVIVLAFELARRFELDRVAFVTGTVAAFALALPREHGPDALGFFRALGGSGLLLAIIVAFAMLGATRALRQRAWLAAAAVIAASALLRLGGISLADGVSLAMQPLGRLGDSYGALATIVVVETLLWLVGIHGPALLAAVVTPVYLTLQGENATAFAIGAPLPHVVTTSTFLFIFPGGAGATLPLVALMLRSRLRALRILAAASIGPGALGINEPLMFGLPLVFEPIFAIPFVVAPLVLSATTFAAIASGLVARPAYYVPASIPPVLNVFLATTDWRACALAVANILIAGAIYFPFLRIYERTRA